MISFSRLPDTLSSGTRIDWVDSLRGLALLAILFANIPFAGWDHTSISRGWMVGSMKTDDELSFLFQMLIDKKFIGIFSMLFGFGCFIQMKSAADSGKSPSSYLLKRMVVLFILGCVHAYFLWFGDIIRYYAIGGVLVIFVYHWRPLHILYLGIGVTLMTGAAFIASEVFELPYSYDAAIIVEHGLTSSYLRYLEINFIIDPIALLITGPIIGLSGSYLFWKLNHGTLELTPEMLWLPFLIVASFVFQSLFYICVFAWLYFSWKGKILTVFRSVGKMSMTAYVLQSIFYVIFFYHWTGGLKLYGAVTLTEAYLIVLVLFAIEVLLCRLWLRFFHQGPIEFIWKRVASRLNAA